MDRQLAQIFGLIFIFLLIAVAVWVNARVEELAALLHISKDYAWSVVRMGVLPALFLAFLLYKLKLLEALAFLPASALFALSPALTYWSWNVIAGEAMNDSPEWYGLRLVQLLGVAVLAGIPTWWFWLRDHY